LFCLGNSTSIEEERLKLNNEVLELLTPKRSGEKLFQTESSLDLIFSM
jgi:hypothetical protein